MADWPKMCPLCGERLDWEHADQPGALYLWCVGCENYEGRDYSAHDFLDAYTDAAARVAELEKALKQVRREARLILFSQAARRIERTCDKALAEGEEKEG